MKYLAKPLLFFRVAAFAVALISCPSIAEQNSKVFYGDKEEGWFFYKDPRELKPKAPVPVQPEPPKSEKQVEKKSEMFSVEWLRANMDKLRDVAIDNPTDTNIRAYLYAQRVTLDKAQNFANAASVIANTDPLLDENNRIPFASALKASLMRVVGQAREDTLKQMAQKGGIWFFFDSKCDMCRIQYPVLESFRKQYGFVTRNISMDGKALPGMEQFLPDHGQAAGLGLKITPTLVFVVPPNNYMIISQGANSVDGIGDKVLLAANHLKLVPEDLARKQNVFNNGILSTEEMKGLEQTEDPEKWVEYLQKALGGKK